MCICWYFQPCNYGMENGYFLLRHMQENRIRIISEQLCSKSKTTNNHYVLHVSLSFARDMDKLLQLFQNPKYIFEKKLVLPVFQYLWSSYFHETWCNWKKAQNWRELRWKKLNALVFTAPLDALIYSPTIAGIHSFFLASHALKFIE